MGGGKKENAKYVSCISDSQNEMKFAHGHETFAAFEAFFLFEKFYHDCNITFNYI